jgi:hypothetical protein
LVCLQRPTLCLFRSICGSRIWLCPRANQSNSLKHFEGMLNLYSSSMAWQRKGGFTKVEQSS